jgi:hypothetical protein
MIKGKNELEKFDNILARMKAIHVAKNHDYGNSFDKTLEKFGINIGLARINDKFERAYNLLNPKGDKDNAKVDESVEDTLIDLANYAVMTLSFIERSKHTDVEAKMDEIDFEDVK